MDTCLGLLTGMKEDDESRLIKIFPNPTNGQFNMQINQLSNLQMNSVVIYNVLGEKVYAAYLPQIPQNCGTNCEIDLNSQPNGVYFYRVVKEDGGLVGQGKLVIER